MSHKRFVQHAFLALALALCAVATAAKEPGAQGEHPAPPLKVVVAEGVGTHANRAKARDDAISDAQRRAVEVGVGLYIESRTLVENAQLIEDTIYQHSQGYVHSCEVLSDEYRQGECRVKIRAQVRTGKIEEDLDDIWARLKVAGSPRFIVAIEQPQESDVPGLVQSVVTEKLVGYGFKVLDEGQLGRARWKTALRLASDVGRRPADAFSLQDAADVVIAGRASYRLLGTPDASLDVYSCDAALDARAVRTDTAEIVTGGRAASGPKAAFRQDQAVETALRTVADEWVQRHLGRLVQTGVDPTHEYTLVIVGGSHADVEGIDRQLGTLRFVRRTTLRAFDGGVAQIEVQFIGTAQRLASDMRAFKSPSVHVESVTAATVRVRVG